MGTFTVDGDEVEGREGESVAVAMVRAGRFVFGRSVKYHRPRGPVCFRARCEGCLMRVDGRPNVMTCREPVQEGMKVETQNVVGSAKYDLLSLTDWIYPKGIDHHHFWTRFRIPNAIMKAIARRIAGIGRLPDSVRTSASVLRSNTDVLVIGAGIAGINAANAAAKLGAKVMVVDEAIAIGGEARLLRAAGAQAPSIPPLGPPVERRLRTTAVALFHEDPAGAPVRGALVMLDRGDQLELVEARRVIIATGVTGGALAFEGNDLPGVLTATGALVLLAHGVAPKAVAFVGEGPLLEATRSALKARGVDVVGSFSHEHVRAEGDHQVRRLVAEQAHAVDWVIAGAPPSAALELAVQGGAESRWAAGGFAVVADESGRAAEDLWAVGSVTGVRGSAAALQGCRAGEAAAR